MDAIQEMIVFLIILVGFLLLVSRLQQQTVLQIFVVVYGMFGVCALVMPSVFAAARLLMVNGELGDLHYFLVRVLGVCCLSLAGTIYMNHNATDAYTRVSLFFGLFLISFLNLFVHVLTPATIEKSKESKGVTKSNESIWKYEALGFAVVQAVCIIRAKDFFGHSQLQSRLNMHLKVDFILNLVFGVLLFAYPKLLFGHLTNTKSFDEIIITFIQVYGAYSIGSGTLSLLYTSVLWTVNKRHLMMVKVLETLCLIVLILLTNFTSKSLGGCVQTTLLMYSLMSFNALLGYYAPHETDGYVSKDK